MNKLLNYLFPQWLILKSAYYLFEEFKESDAGIIAVVKRACFLVGISFIVFCLCFIDQSFILVYLLIHLFLVNHPFISNIIEMEHILKDMPNPRKEN